MKASQKKRVEQNEVNIDPIESRSGEVELDPKVIAANTNQKMSTIKYWTAAGVTVMVLIVCLLVVTCWDDLKFYDDAVRLIFIIAGGVVASVYNTQSGDS